jgi:predicted PurR-regulated permease PerM
MQITKVVEYAFFFGLLLLSGYVVWLILSPFVTALALSAIIVTICYPLYDYIQKKLPKVNQSLVAFLATLFVLSLIILPIVLVSSLIVREAVTFYQDLETGDLTLQSSLMQLESYVQSVIPGFSVDISELLKSGADWLTGNLGSIFASTVTAIFTFFIALLGTFYFFRDGKTFLKVIIKASPLNDREDQIIFQRMARAVRAVATGTVLVALIQGTLVAIGFMIFGIDRAILWGTVASVGALLPGIGTTIVTVPAVIYLFYTGEMFSAIGLLVWSVAMVGTIDNLIGPYLMSRGNKLHPFLILISVLGGIALFGPIGFIVGPVMVTLFLVLLEIYSQNVVQEKPLENKNNS